MLEPMAIGALLFACTCAGEAPTINPVDYTPPANQPIWTVVEKHRQLPDEPPVLWHEETWRLTPTTYGERIELAPRGERPGNYLQQFIPQSTLQEFSTYRFGYLENGEFDLQRSEFGISVGEPIEFTGRPASVSVLGVETPKLNGCLVSAPRSVFDSGSSRPDMMESGRCILADRVAFSATGEEP